MPADLGRRSARAAIPGGGVGGRPRAAHDPRPCAASAASSRLVTAARRGARRVRAPARSRSAEEGARRCWRAAGSGRSLSRIGRCRCRSGRSPSADTLCWIRSTAERSSRWCRGRLGHRDQGPIAEHVVPGADRVEGDAVGGRPRSAPAARSRAPAAEARRALAPKSITGSRVRSRLRLLAATAR